MPTGNSLLRRNEDREGDLMLCCGGLNSEACLMCGLDVMRTHGAGASGWFFVGGCAGCWPTADGHPGFTKERALGLRDGWFTD